MNQSKGCYSYIRFSDRREKKISLDRQITVTSEYCELHDLPTPKPIIDTKVSGGDLSRKGLVKLLGLIESGECKILVVYSLCRLTRDLEIQARLNKLLLKGLFELHSIYESIQIRDPEPEALFMLNNYSNMNELERRKTSKRMLMFYSARRKKKQRTAGRTPPFGFDEDENHNLVPNKKEQAALDLMVKLRAEGLSYRKIARALFEKGYKTKTQLCWFEAQTIKSLIQRHKSNEEEVA